MPTVIEHCLGCACVCTLQHQEPARAPEHEEVGLLPAGLLENMEQDMLVAHIKAVQEELYAKVGD